MRTIWFLAVSMASALSAPPILAQDGVSNLPGGATSLQETYEDWRLTCRSAQPNPSCVVSQEQARQNGQRVLAIELRGSGDDGFSGNLVLPFGLRLSAGATLQIDDSAAGAPLSFSTCLPAGCIVPLLLKSDYLAGLQSGTTLRVKVQSMESQDITMQISLKGFATALKRLKALEEV